MPVYLPNGTQEILIFKSSSGEERQICECLEWRGGRVDHPDQLRDGSNAVAAASPAPPGPKKPMAIVAIVAIVAIRYIREGFEYPETPIKNSTAGKCGRTRPRIA